jgi:transposase
VPIDNNHIENQIRPIAIGRNGHDPYAYLKDVLTRLPTQRNSMIAQLLPHRWTPATASA